MSENNQQNNDSSQQAAERTPKFKLGDALFYIYVERLPGKEPTFKATPYKAVCIEIMRKKPFHYRFRNPEGGSFHVIPEDCVFDNEVDRAEIIKKYFEKKNEE